MEATSENVLRFDKCEGEASHQPVSLRPTPKGANVHDFEGRAPASISHRKRYGQFFTPSAVAALVCAGAINPETTRIVDPMCGDGTVLRAAAERAQLLEGKRKANRDNNQQSILGVEADASLAQHAVRQQDDCQAFWNRGGRILHAEAFTTLSGLLTETPQVAFDAIVGNPPYVRYQEMAFLLDEVCPALAEAFQNEMSSARPSSVAQSIIRAALLHAVTPLKASSVEELARKSIQILNKPEVAVRHLDPVASFWTRLVAGYSGLSDLSLPSWLLAGAVAAPDARIAFVSTTAWQNREYGRPLRYFMLRMLQPLAIVEQEKKSWFPEADVDASLLIFRVRSRAEISEPLSKRQSNHRVVRLRIRRPYDLAEPSTLCRVAGELGDYEGVSLSEAAHEVMQVLNTFSTAEEVVSDETSLYKLDHVIEQDMIDQLLSGEPADGPLWTLEDQAPHAVHARRSDKSAQRIPDELRRSLSLPRAMNRRVRNFCDYGATANQGLRTGCNAFFYLRDFSLNAWNEFFSKRARSDVDEVLANPTAHPQEALAIAERVEEEGGLAPTEPVQQWLPSRLVMTDSELGELPCLFPASWLVPAIRYQRELNEPLIYPEQLVNQVFVARCAATPDDFEDIRKRYSSALLSAWHQQYQLETLPSVPAAFVKLGEQVTLQRGGKDVHIPRMSAVAPNIRVPSGERDLFDEVPDPPAWWYTLRIRSRHHSSVFMPRVNSGPACAYVCPAERDILVDANFSTFSRSGSGDNAFSENALLAFLNSGWTQLNLEHIATRMGGGALKVEAAHLRRLAVPTLTDRHTRQLDQLGNQLIETADQRQETLQKVDMLLVEALMADPTHPTDGGQHTATELTQRIRKTLDKKVETRKG